MLVKINANALPGILFTYHTLNVGAFAVSYKIRHLAISQQERYYIFETN